MDRLGMASVAIKRPYAARAKAVRDRIAKLKAIEMKIAGMRLAEDRAVASSYFGFGYRQYNIIYADPPWAYAREGQNGSAEKHYKTMDIEAIAEMPAGGLAADDCVLVMWCTWKHIDNGIALMRAWGFEYCTILYTWIKSYGPPERAPGRAQVFIGKGELTRSNTEFCLYGRRGNILRMKDPSIVSSSVWFSELREHSRKPDDIRHAIVRMFGDLPRIELFATCRVPGWDSWGNELTKFDVWDEQAAEIRRMWAPGAAVELRDYDRVWKLMQDSTARAAGERMNALWPRQETRAFRGETDSISKKRNPKK